MTFERWHEKYVLRSAQQHPGVIATMKTKSFRAAVVQTLAVLGDLDENIRRMREYTAEAVRQGAKLVVFPECMNTGYLFDSVAHCRALAEPVTGRYAEAMSVLARKH